METVSPFDWHRIFFGTKNNLFYLGEISFRVVFIYLLAVIFLRFMGKRGNRSLSIYENVLIIALGSATGDVMFYPEVPLFYATLVIIVIVLLTRWIQFLQLYSKKFNYFLDGTPVILIENGELNITGLKSSRIREEELYGLLRVKGVKNVSDVEIAVLERTGELSVLPYEVNQHNNSDKTNLFKRLT